MNPRTDLSARYAFREVDLQEKGDTRTQQVLMVGTRKEVLEIGPASGYVTKALRKRGCNVTCVEVDSKAARAARKYATRMINADIETMDLEKELGGETYDVILFGDVLEHLKDPKAILRRLRPYLKTAGHVVATVPNVAHGSVRLLLLDGRFDPQATGILDRTHLHFYTRRTLLELFRDAGYSVERVEEIKTPISAAENLRVNLKEYPAELVRAMESDPSSTTHEFAVVARPAMGLVSQRFPSQRQLVSRRLGLRRYDPLSTLLHLYFTRRDVQAAFPEVREGNYRRLLDWANNMIENRVDNAYRLLRRYASWYRDNPISSEPELRRVREELATLQEELATLQEELDGIKNSFGYKLMRFYSTRIDRVFPDGTRRGEFRRRVVRGLEIVTSQGNRELLRVVAGRGGPDYTEGIPEIRIERLPHMIQVTEPSTMEETERKPLETSVSVVILTKAPPKDFEQTLERLRHQKGVSDPEIVVVNSGSRDLSPLATKYRMKLFNIQPREFDHAMTRNYGAEKATGEFLLFLTDDAIPARDDLIFDMVRILLNDNTIGAVTARQIPRSDADFMYCQAIWWHYRSLGLAWDRVVGSSEIEKTGLEQKRAICQIDDVCSCFRRETFLKYRYSKGYAEDLELGIRLTKDGYKIAQLFSTGVVHSHNRPSSYYLKRAYVDFQALHRLLGYETQDFETYSVKSPHDLLDLILTLECSINRGVHDLRAAGFCQNEIRDAFNMIRSRLRTVAQNVALDQAEDADLMEMLSQIMEILEYNEKQKHRATNPLIDRYVGSLGIFEKWISSSYQDLTNVETQFVDTLYKLFALQVGNILSHYVAYARQLGRVTKSLVRLDRFLSEGI